MSVSGRKKRNTDFERRKKMQRDKALKKKQMRTGQLPPKHAKGEHQRS